jgi:hypothetical protein
MIKTIAAIKKTLDTGIVTVTVSVLACALFLFMPQLALAACSWTGNTGTVASPYAATDVADCVTDASGKTGAVIIQIPDSTPTHSATITVNMSSGFTNVTGLTIRGQNDCTMDGNGIPTACGTVITTFKVSYTGLEGKAFRLAHLQVEGTSGVSIDGNGKSWRIDHIFWNHVTGMSSARIIWIGKGTAGWLTEGLLDHNYILHPVWGSFVHYQPTADGGNLEWMTGPELGTSHAVYLENNKVVSDLGGWYFTENNGASRYVVRYNEIHNATLAGHDYSTGGFRGSFKIEVYGNTLNYDITGNCYVINRAGANGVFFNNTITWSGAGELCSGSQDFNIFRRVSNTECASTSGKATLATSATYVDTCESGDGCINVDGTGSPDGYPCRDQVGVSGNNPQVGGGAPYLLWNNTKNGGAITVGATADYVVADRDYCLHATTLPATCNSITTSTYWPGAYTYPHPLAGLSSTSQFGGITGVGVVIK